MSERKDNLMQLRESYEKFNMSDEAYTVMRQRMEQGKKERMMTEKKVSRINTGWLVTAAAAVTILVLPNLSPKMAYAMGNLSVVGKLFQIVTFRDFQYDDGVNSADVVVPEISVSEEDGQTAEAVSEINSEIQSIAASYIKNFEAEMNAKGYRSIDIKSEVVMNTAQYFTLKLMCYESSASGYEENRFYTIDKATGKRVGLADLFTQGSDYVTPISESIKRQMRERMAAGNDAVYWIDEEEIPDANFDRIVPDADFYLNAAGEVVISFDEGEAAPAYMGTVEFTIPAEELKGIRR